MRTRSGRWTLTHELLIRPLCRRWANVNINSNSNINVNINVNVNINININININNINININININGQINSPLQCAPSGLKRMRSKGTQSHRVGFTFAKTFVQYPISHINVQ